MRRVSSRLDSEGCHRVFYRIVFQGWDLLRPTIDMENFREKEQAEVGMHPEDKIVLNSQRKMGALRRIGRRVGQTKRHS